MNNEQLVGYLMLEEWRKMNKETQMEQPGLFPEELVPVNYSLRLDRLIDQRVEALGVLTYASVAMNGLIDKLMERNNANRTL